MNGQDDMITIFTTSDSMQQPSVPHRGVRDLMSNAAVKTSEISVNTVQKNFLSFIKAVDRILGSMPETVGDLRLGEVEIHAEIDGKGKIGISSIAGAEIAAKGGIKFVLRREM